MIYLIGEATEAHPLFRQGQWEWFLSWLKMNNRREFEFDIETTVTPHWCTKKVITVQFGDTDNQWVMQWSALTAEQKLFIQQILEDESYTKIIHYALFECTVMLFHGIRIRNVFDTLLAEQVRWGGDDNVDYSLESICYRRLGVILDKSYQTAFGDNILTPGKIEYAAQDVRYLSILKMEIYRELVDLGLDWTIALENEAVLAFAEKTYNGMAFDADWWKSLYEEAVPIVKEAVDTLNKWLHEPEFAAKAYELGYLCESDRVTLNLNSPVQKQLVFSELYPDIPGHTKAIVKKYQSNKLKNGESVPEWVPFYLDGDTSELINELLTKHRQWMIDRNMLVPANTPTINWNSQAQVMPLIACVERNVKSLDKESRARMSHPIILDYDEFLQVNKLLTTYGEQWLKYVEPDGKVRTTFNLILVTGRISSAKPNMQQIPAKERVGNKYRNAFVPPPGWSFVSSDYVSQELIVIAYLSKDPVWAEALSKGQDLHSIAAEMVFGKTWKEAADKNCAYYQQVVDDQGALGFAKQKCKCIRHKYMRNGIKTINFGLAYGMSEFKLAATLRIKVPEAKQLIVDYFKAFPGIGSLLTFLGAYGVRNGYIQTIWPFYRKRFFPFWRHYLRFVDSHLMGAQYHPGLGEIERASKNMPIQGTSADMMKLALCMIYWAIHDVLKVSDKVRMVMQVHDQADTNARNDYAEEWALCQTAIMEKAAEFIIPTGILKAETTITERWSK